MSALDRLKAAAKAAKEGGQKGSYGDGNEYYYPVTDAAGNGSAVIRFLPAKSEDDLPWVQVYSHGYKGPSGKWYIEECPTTIGGQCPQCESNAAIVAKYGDWKTTPEAEKKTVRDRKRKMNYIANILVVSDPKTPDNEGKVMLYKFGAKIFDKIYSKLNPEFEDEKECVVFDPEEGANFKLRIRKVEGQTNYDKSEFEDASSIGSKSEIKKVLEQLHDLGQFTAPSRFKSYDDLKAKVNTVLGNTVRVAPVKDDLTFDLEPSNSSKPKAIDDEDDEIRAMMAKLAADD